MTTELLLPDAESLVGMTPSRQRHFSLLRLRQERDNARAEVEALQEAISRHQVATRRAGRQRVCDENLYDVVGGSSHD